MRPDQLAVILYTLREHCTNIDDLRESLRKVRAIGYQSVQVSGVPASIPADAIRAALDDTGLTCCATHEPASRLFDATDTVVQRLHTLGCSITAYPYPADVDLTSTASVDAMIQALESAGQHLAAHQLTLCYHNHANEFFHLEGQPVLQRIYQQTSPAALAAELDTFWVQAGGASVLDWIQQMNGRLPILHIKDYRVNEKGERAFAEIGNGNLDWPAIIHAAQKAGCQWFVVEQDVCPGDPFDSIAQSFNFCAKHLFT